MYTPKSITEIRDGSTKSEVASDFPITQGLEWKQMNLSKENQGTVLRERGRGTGEKKGNTCLKHLPFRLQTLSIGHG